MKPAAGILLLSTLALAACGGGHAPAPEHTAASTRACLTPVPGVEYLMSDGHTQRIVQEEFEGKTAYAEVELRPDGTRSMASYAGVGEGFFNMLGNIEYDPQGQVESKTVNSGTAQFPLDLTPGQTVQIAYQETYTETQPVAGRPGKTPSTIVGDIGYPLTFAGFENLRLGGREFPNSCKFVIGLPTSGVEGTEVALATWYAPGFGMIKGAAIDAKGNALPDSTVELKSVIKAP